MLPYSFTIPAAICLLGALHLFLAYFKWFEIRQKLRFHVKYFLYHAAIAFLFGCTTIPCLLNPGSAENMKYAKKLYHISKVASWFGLTIVTEGQENMRAVKAPVVIICNHQTSLDVLIAIKVSAHTPPRREESFTKLEESWSHVFGSHVKKLEIKVTTYKIN